MMRKAMTALMMVGAMAAAASANVLMSDDFDSYNQGNLVPQDAWAAHSGAGNKPVQVVPGEDCFCQADPSDVNCIELVQSGGSGEDVNKPIGQTMGAGDIWYAGFCVKVDGTTPLTADDYFAHFKTSGTYYGGKVFVAPFNGSDYTFGFQAAGGGDDAEVLWQSGFEFGSCHRVVVSYEFDTGCGQMWVDPDCDLGPGENYCVSNTGYTGNAFVAWAFRQASDVTCTQDVDNVLVSTSWTDACCNCVPEPATVGLLMLGSVPLLLQRRRQGS